MPSEERGLRPIGSHLPQIVNLPLRTDSTPTGQPRNSATISRVCPASEASSSTGLRPGATGAVATPRELAQTGADPEQTDQALLASLKPSLRASLAPQYRTRTGEYGMEFDVIGYALGEVDAAALEHGRGVVAAALAPAPPKVLAAELARLRALTKARAEDSRDLTLMATAYAEEMASYPADVVRWACRKWARMEKFWPSWAELKDLLDRAIANRHALASALSRGRAAP